MARMAPPEPPETMTQTGDGDMDGMRFRLWQILMAGLTVLFSGYFVTFGVVPAILSLMIAKHVLVAILAVGLQGSPPPR